MTPPCLTLKRRFDAPPAKVFAAWIEPTLIMRWMGPREIENVEAVCDPRVGGAYRFVMRAKDGETHEVSGVYREIVENEKLVFTWAWRSTPERQSLVTILIRPDGDGALLTLTHEQFADVEARDRHAHGWGGSLDRLEAALS